MNNTINLRSDILKDLMKTEVVHGNVCSVPAELLGEFLNIDFIL